MKKLHLSDHLNESFRNIGKNPASDWRLALAAFAVLLVLGVLLNVFLYTKLAGRSEASFVNMSESSQVFDRAELDAVAHALESKSTDASDLPVSVLSDPSL